MEPHDDPEKRIRELETPLTDSARASEIGSAPPSAQPYPAPPPGAYPPPPASAYPPPAAGPMQPQYGYGGLSFGTPPQPGGGHRMWWILGTLIVVGAIALAGGIAAFASQQLNGVRSIIASPPTASRPMKIPPNTPGARPPSVTAAPTPPAGGPLSVSGINANRTIVCNNSTVTVSGVSNTVVITGHCASLSVSGVQNSITLDNADTIDASGFNNKITYHSGTPKVTNGGDSNVVQRG